MTRTYDELIKINSFENRAKYLDCSGIVGKETFGSARLINQRFYKSDAWQKVRNEVILRDNGCDLGHPDRPIFGQVLIHHIEPITLNDILEENPKVLDLNNLVCCSKHTHNCIHYGDAEGLVKDHKERSKGDTCLWKVY